MTEAVGTSETADNFYEITRRNIPEICHLHTRHRENLNSYSSILVEFELPFMRSQHFLAQYLNNIYLFMN
jgi:hypothetical protein